MLHFQYAGALGILMLIVESQHTDVDDVPKPLPEEYILDLYEKYKEAVEDGNEEGVVSRRQLRRLNREFDIHVRRLKAVNGYKAHNLAIREKTETGILIYIDNPLESRVPHAYLSLEEFRKALEKRATRQRNKKSDRKQTEVYFGDSDVDIEFDNKDMRRKKVLGGGHANFFEAKRTKSRHFEHTYVPGKHRGKKHHENLGAYYFETQKNNLSMVTKKSSQPMNYANVGTTPYSKPIPKPIQVTTETPDSSNAVEGIPIMGLDDMVKNLDAVVKDANVIASEADSALHASATLIATLEVNAQPEGNAEPVVHAAPKLDTEPENMATVVLLKLGTVLEKSPEAVGFTVHHHHKLSPARLLRSGTDTTRKINATINKGHNLPTKILLKESSTVAIMLNVTQEEYINSTEVMFRASNETTKTEGNLTALDFAVTDTVKTIEVNGTARDDNVTETVTPKDDDVTKTVTAKDNGVIETVTSKDDDVTDTMTAKDDNVTETVTAMDDDTAETVTTTKVNITTKDDETAKEQPVRPIWMRPRYPRITTTRTTTTPRTLGRPLVFMNG